MTGDAVTGSPQPPVPSGTGQLVTPAGARRRRPTGKPPPLPREIGTSGKVWVASIVILVALVVLLFVFPIGDPITRAESAFLRRVAAWRTEVVTDLMLALNALGSEWLNRLLRWGTLIALVLVRRWRHLLVFLATVLFVTWLTTKLGVVVRRPRPLGVTILASWEGPSFPSASIAALGLSLLGVAYTLIVPGRPRHVAKWAIGALIGLLAAARLYLGVDHPSDVVFGAILGVGIPVVAYRLLTPNAVFPVRYGHGRAAHLDIGGRRGEAIRQALEDQIGVRVDGIEPFGLAGSGGSTPMRIEASGDLPQPLFGKLYARTHLRADRWYKLGRTILYGTLEDEKPYNSVRRLVQYEDYVLRVMNDAGLPCARTFGFVEITPEREYLLVTEFIEGGAEIGKVELTDAIIDDALSVVRRMWDAGLAHRDIKPANLLVREDRIFLIDPAFGELRPSPWRQAVDLANMMIVLALGADADRVYTRALQRFTPEEIAEAFAATKSVTIPSQSRSLLRRRSKAGQDILKRFRELAPERRPISIQRWSLQRIGLTGMAAIGMLVSIVLLVDNLRSGAL